MWSPSNFLLPNGKLVQNKCLVKGLVSVDGQVRQEIGPNDVLRVAAAEKSFKLVRVGVRSYYSILRQKLGWSGAPKYRPPARR